MNHNELTESEWQAEHKFLKIFSPFAGSPPPAAFFLGGIFNELKIIIILFRHFFIYIAQAITGNRMGFWGFGEIGRAHV